MSKLFDTLEKIQNKDSFSPATSGGIATPPEQKINKVIIFLIALAASAVVIFLILQNIDTFKLPGITGKQSLSKSDPQDQLTILKEITSKQTKPIQQTNQTTDPELQPVSKNILAQMTQLNNQGVKLIERSEHWQGIYYLNKAHALSPQSVEPIVNMAVALMELGLSAPANRFFSEALTLDPNNRKLRDNLALGAQYGILDDSLLLLVTGETRRP